MSWHYIQDNWIVSIQCSWIVFQPPHPSTLKSRLTLAKEIYPFVTSLHMWYHFSNLFLFTPLALLPESSIFMHELFLVICDVMYLALFKFIHPLQPILSCLSFSPWLQRSCIWFWWSHQPLRIHPRGTRRLKPRWHSSAEIFRVKIAEVHLIARQRYL